MTPPSDAAAPAPDALARLRQLYSDRLPPPGTTLEELICLRGVVTALSPGTVEIAGLSPFVAMGEIVAVEAGRRAGEGPLDCEVVRIGPETIVVKAFEDGSPPRIGAAARRVGPFRIRPHDGWKGRVIDARARPIDGRGPLPHPVAAGPVDALPVDRSPPEPMRRGRADRPVATGIRAVDIFAPLCAGQRIGIFAGSGVGKSTLLAMLARAQGFDTVVIALVGERGREVRDFIEETLGEGRARAVTVVATGDESAALRRLAPRTAMTVAEHFRDRGERVLLVMDSVTRYAHAAREVALSAGEPAVARGYAPTVFSDLPRLLERAGPGTAGADGVPGGSITGIFSVLVDGDDHNDPVADAIRGTLDGHIVLTRSIAASGRFPAVDTLASVSRLAERVWSPEQRILVSRLRAMIARYEETRDLRLMGGYQAGSDAELDQAVLFVPRIYAALAQRPGEVSDDPFRDLATAMQGG